ncbi:VOC family protein [Novosphingobium lentum]|uniref:VOC family protein n=1 Tax=Novosphingobium lentum TaxID=145287 RepID=UPI000834FC06|nr:VOC family protein [Novosphingobium lentum]
MQLDHINIRTAKLDASIAFYGEVLGLRMEPPPMCADMRAAAWGRDSAGQAVVHLVAAEHEIESGGPVRGAAQRGMIDHFALRCDDRASHIARLERAGLAFEQTEVPAIGLQLVFVRDPNGILVELGFALPALAENPA